MINMLKRKFSSLPHGDERNRLYREYLHHQALSQRIELVKSEGNTGNGLINTNINSEQNLLTKEDLKEFEERQNKKRAEDFNKFSEQQKKA
jgi:hypothetical protein